MKFILFFVLVAFIAHCNGVSQPVIRNTQSNGCFDGQCGNHCFWKDENIKIWPNGALNQPGKCRLLQCRPNYDIAITPCPFDRKIFRF
jgi:hypothetical protein